MEADHNMSAPSDIENVIQKCMTKLELESYLASAPFYFGESIKNNWSNVELLLEERESIRSCIAQLESGHEIDEVDKKFWKTAVEAVRNSLQGWNEIIDSLCRKWSDLLCKSSDVQFGTGRWCYKNRNDYAIQNEKYEEDIRNEIAYYITQIRNGYKECGSDQNSKLEEFLDDIATLHVRISLLLMRWRDLDNAFSKVSQRWSKKSGVKHLPRSEVRIQGILYQLHDNHYRIKQLEAENESKRHGLMIHDMRITMLENAAKINDQKLIDLEQNLAAKEEQIVRISAVLVPIAKDLENYVRELKSQGNRKNKQSKKKVKSALRAVKGKHEIEEKNRKLTKQVVRVLKGQWDHFSQGVSETQKKHFQSLSLGQELANRKVDQRIASLEVTMRNEMVAFKNNMCMERQRELKQVKVEQEGGLLKIIREVETLEDERMLLSTVQQAEVIKKVSCLGKEGKVVRGVKDRGNVYVRRGLRCKKTLRRRHRRLHKSPMINNARSRERLKLEKHPMHEAKFEVEGGLVKKSQLKGEKLTVSHLFLERENHAYLTQVRNGSVSSDHSLVTRDKGRFLSQCDKSKRQGVFGKHQKKQCHKGKKLSVGKKPRRIWGIEDNPSKVLMVYSEGKHCLSEFELSLPSDFRMRPKHHRRLLFMIEMALEVKFVVSWNYCVTVTWKKCVRLFMGI